MASRGAPPHAARPTPRGTAAGLVALSGATMLACGPSGPSKKPAAPVTTGGTARGTPRAGGTFYSYNSANLNSWDPQGGASQSSSVLTNPVYGGLFRFKSGPDPQVFLNLDTENNLASSIESPDGVTWTIKLRPGARFHDVPPVNGHTVQAEDVKATFQRAFAITNNTNRSLLTMIDPNQVEAPAADTVVFKLKYAFGPFHGTLAGTGTDICKRSAPQWLQERFGESA